MGGILLLNAAFALCMIACVEAFDAGPMNYAAIALVYLAGSTLGQAAPDPGRPRRRGGGVRLRPHRRPASTPASRSRRPCCSASLTFWLPTLPGYWSFNWLQRVGSL